MRKIIRPVTRPILPPSFLSLLPSFLLILALVPAQILIARLAMAEDPATIATLFSLEGSATVTREGEGAGTAAAIGTEFRSGDLIKVDKLSRAGLQFQDGGFVRLGSLASLVFQSSGDAGQIDIKQGNAYFFSRSPRRYPEITTPTVSAAMRGTEFSVQVDSDATTVAVLEGSVELSNSAGSALLGRGEGARVRQGEAPAKQLLINLPDTVQWMVQVPFVGAWSDYEETAPSNSEFQGVLRALERGEPAEALAQSAWVKTFARAGTLIQQRKYQDALNLIGSDTSEPALQLLAGRVALSLGEIERGEKLLASQGQSASAASTRTLLMLSRGDLPAALRELAARPVTDSFSDLVVRSLVAQANRDLESSIEYLNQALKHYPNSHFLKVRRAELALAAGELDQAAAMVEPAQAESDDGYTQAIAGFVHLARGEREPAEKNFEAAIKSPTSAALGYLGSALVHTVRGEQQTGIDLFQQAVLLDPKSGMLRSYLGKAYSESNREQSAENEYQLAMELDPNDPTPWIYRSYSRIAQNRPVEALNDIEESISRNDNRAIFRSSFLLDQDSAVRSASLARVFNELGFSDAGRIEAIKSISRQYTNFSAHRLLAETQDTIFLADASFSERRISDLMAPLSLNLFDSISGSVTLNEYSALFERDQTRFAFGGDYISFDDLYAPSFLAAGKQGNFGYSFSAGAIGRDGSAHNNSNQDYRIGSMVQYQPSWRDRLSLAATGQYVRNSDTNASEQEADLRKFGADFGYLHTFAPGVLTVISSSVQRYFDDGSQFGSQEEILSTQIVDGVEDTIPVDVITDHSRDSFLTSVQNEAQFIFDSRWMSSVTGASVSRLTSDRFDDPLVLEDSLGELTGQGVRLPSSQENSLSSYSVYSYQTAHLTDWLHLTGGLSVEEVERDLTEVPPFVDASEKLHKVSPKFGVVMNPVKNLTVRTSYGEGLRKAVVEDQVSIEPTMLGGMNQRFNDFSGTKNRQYGAGLDWKIPQSTYTGIEWSRRHIDEPLSFATNQFVVDFDTEESYNAVQFNGTSQFYAEQDFVRAYLSQILSKQLVLTFDSRYSKQRFTDPDSFERIEDNRSSANLKYFHTSGLILFSRALWRYQDRQGVITVPDGSENFWQFDAGAGYRFSGRHGIVRLELRNLLDKSFDLDQTTGFEQTLSPSRAVFLSARYNY